MMVGVCTHLGCVPLGQQGRPTGWLVLPVPRFALRYSRTHPQRPCAAKSGGSGVFVHFRHRHQDRLKGSRGQNYECRTFFLRAQDRHQRKWFDARLPLPQLMYDSFVAYPVPRNLNYAYAFGGILAIMLVIRS